MDLSPDPPSRWSRYAGDLLVGLAATLARVAVLIWAGNRFPPAADGVYYHTIAERVAAGLGSTWLWPDGTVTYAAHYPIGYPALLAMAYRMGGVSPLSAGILNAVIGVAGAIAAYRLAGEATRPAPALAAGIAVAIHPALLMYTPALMTEGVTAALVTAAVWMASRRGVRGMVGLGVIVGVATLVRPQSLLLAPLLAFFSPMPAPTSSPSAPWSTGLRARLARAAVASALAVAVCLPWTVRNCVRMHSCALVSFNGGWNLLIGAHPEATGAWSPIQVPEACRTVWDEAQKDACFGREARRYMATQPGHWLRLVPARLAATFDYSGAPGYYLHASNREAFDDHAKESLGAMETLYERLAYLAALVMAALPTGRRHALRIGVAAVSIVLLFQLHAYLAVLGLIAVLGLHGRDLLARPFLHVGTLVVLGSTVLVHATFFGSGRYSMVAFPLVTALAFAWPARRAKTLTPF